MAAPFIHDVLEGAFEWRLQSQSSLGVLLSESFERRLFRDPGAVLGASSELGLILNTTMTGQPIADAPTLVGALVSPDDKKGEACQDSERPVNMLAGGRLAFTNLLGVEDFIAFRPDIPNVQMPFVLVRDGDIPLAPAAALSANFPPVFPNARIDLTGFAADARNCTTRSYFVTDGGAMEDLGLISALMALKGALEDSRLRGHAPQIHVVLAEASAFDYDYEQDRGVGVMTDTGKERLTGRLTLELRRQVEAAAETGVARSVFFHDLSLPRLFRSRGGIGTNWMFPESVRIMDPQPLLLPNAWQRDVEQFTRLNRYWVTLDRNAVLDVWADLFPAQTGVSFCQASSWRGAEHGESNMKRETVRQWICGDQPKAGVKLAPDPQPSTWEQLRDVLAQTHAQGASP